MCGLPARYDDQTLQLQAEAGEDGYIFLQSCQVCGACGTQEEDEEENEEDEKKKKKKKCATL